MIEYKNFTNECGIYCFKNLINGKCYVGQAVNLKNRLRSHYSSIRKGTNSQLAFYRAAAKYGIENFDLFIIEYVDPTTEHLKDVLDELEKKYIQEYNSHVPNGYNMTLGGDAGVLGLKLTEEQKDKIRKASQKQHEADKKHIWARKISEPKYYYGWTYEEAAEKTGVSRGTIIRVCTKTNRHPYSKGWTFADDEITLFNNVAQALRDMSNGTYDINGGRFVKGDVRCKNNLPDHLKRPVIEVDELGNIIREFDTVSAVVSTLKCNAKSFSGYLHRDSQLKFMGRIFKFKNPPEKRKFTEEHKQKLLANRFTKSVLKFDKDGNLLETFDSVIAAAESVGTIYTSISRCCHRVAKTCKGFIWKFKDNDQ